MQILYYLWTIWSFFIAFVLLIILFPILFVGVLVIPKSRRNMLYVLPHLYSRVCLFCLGVRLEEREREKIDFSQQHIYIFNHTSNLDPLISAKVVGTKAKFLGKAEILAYPVFGFTLRHLYVPVRRQDANDRLRSLEDLTNAIEKGDSLIIYPEGTRNNGPELLADFHKGAFQLSLETGVPIAMFTCPNSYALMRGNSWVLRPGKLLGVWDGPYFPNDFLPDRIEDYKAFLKEKMYRRMLEQYPSGVLGKEA
ncbi:MAG: lysophospholipid acyltransferase family protein [Chitinophagales bacterium]|nr:1-acyl-sn-glycerol-3-phosphate acyltransferase [Bacteroidota bacterium]MCB9043513.1 1-acyl-sn-glycerol-3-phosphate acyltransferase [Chitinophagales bacterium]